MPDSFPARRTSLLQLIFLQASYLYFLWINALVKQTGTVAISKSNAYTILQSKVALKSAVIVYANRILSAKRLHRNALHCLLCHYADCCKEHCARDKRSSLHKSNYIES